MNKKVLVSLGVTGICNHSISEAIESLPDVKDFGCNEKLEAKKKKKADREKKRRAKRLDKMKGKS